MSNTIQDQPARVTARGTLPVERVAAKDSTQPKPKRHVGRRGDLPVAGQLTVGVDAFAKMVGISTVSAYRMLKRGEIPVVRLGGRTLIAVAEIEKLIAARSGAFLEGSA